MNDEMSGTVIKAAFTVHNYIGAGFLEKVYHNAMIVELQLSGLNVKSQYPIEVFYKGIKVGDYFADPVIEDKMIIELKAIEQLHPLHKVQLVNYLQANRIDTGLLINFGNSVQMKRKFRVYNRTGKII